MENSSPTAAPLVSIIIPTLNRVTEVDALLGSIVQLRYAPLEVLIVDQNAGELLDPLVARYAPALPITHLKVCLRGAARARNYGAGFARGALLCFPDDDSELLPDTIARAVAALERTGSAVVFGRAMDRDQDDSVTPFVRQAGYLSRKRHEGMFTEFTMFIERGVFARYPYDESFGIGTFYGSEEAYDLVLRLLHAGVRLFYSPAIRFYHPRKVVDHRSSFEIRRAFTYRCGFAHLCVKHRLYGKLLKRMLQVGLYLGYLALFKRGYVRYYVAELLGLLTGLVVR